MYEIKGNENFGYSLIAVSGIDVNLCFGFFV